ncbi:MAG: hypothetical protein IJO71_08045 [Microbacterium sp.]|uniref:hypothetical protein n=1 Tax=Microbacterium sp. TaxID=51671 RepID=UPI0025E16352|nr:hypothetical protein [Microbacterium sp.]MBQ9917135.1 hypothetical protein [Microbacterium sp.]
MTGTDRMPDPLALEAFVHRCIEVFASREQHRMPRSSARAFRMVFGLCVQTVRYAEAYMALVKSQLSLEARVLVRCAIEHAATAEYAYFRADGLDRLAVSAQWAGWHLRDRMFRWTGIAGFDPGPEPTSEKDARLPGIARDDPRGLLRTLDPNTVMLDPGYAMLSQAVHVTEQTVTGVFRESDDGTGQLQVDLRRDDELFSYTLYLLAECCMLVTYIDAHLRRDAILLEELDFRSEMLNLPLRLDEDWPADDRAHPDLP